MCLDGYLLVLTHKIATYEAFHVNCPIAARERQIVLYVAHVYDTKTYLIYFMIIIFDVFFPQISNGVGSFPEIFDFRLQKVQNVLYLKKGIFNIFYVGKADFQRVLERFSARNRIRKSRRIAFPARGTTRYSARAALTSLPNNSLL